MRKTYGWAFTLLCIISCTAIICSIPSSYAVGQPSGYYLYLLQNAPYNQAINYNLVIITKDALNGTVPLASTVSISISDTSAIFPPTINILDTGYGACTLYFGTSGTQTITVTDNTNNAITSTLSVNVQPIYFHASVSPTTITIGQSVNVTVTAVDQTDTILTNLGNQGYGATLSFSSTDPQAQFPQIGLTSKLVSGTGVYNITLNTAGSQTITVTNRDFPAINVITNQITVNPVATSQPNPTQTVNPTQTASSSPTVNPTSVITTSPTPISTPDSIITTTPHDGTLNQTSPNTTIIVVVVVIGIVLAILGLIIYRQKRRSNETPI
jgi:hypothetical protein